MSVAAPANDLDSPSVFAILAEKPPGSEPPPPAPEPAPAPAQAAPTPEPAKAAAPTPEPAKTAPTPEAPKAAEPAKDAEPPKDEIDLLDDDEKWNALNLQSKLSESDLKNAKALRGKHKDADHVARQAKELRARLREREQKAAERDAKLAADEAKLEEKIRLAAEAGNDKRVQDLMQQLEAKEKEREDALNKYTAEAQRARELQVTADLTGSDEYRSRVMEPRQQASSRLAAFAQAFSEDPATQQELYQKVVAASQTADMRQRREILNSIDDLTPADSGVIASILADSDNIARAETELLKNGQETLQRITERRTKEVQQMQETQMRAYKSAQAQARARVHKMIPAYTRLGELPENLRKIAEEAIQGAETHNWSDSTPEDLAAVTEGFYAFRGAAQMAAESIRLRDNHIKEITAKYEATVKELQAEVDKWKAKAEGLTAARPDIAAGGSDVANDDPFANADTPAQMFRAASGRR